MSTRVEEKVSRVTVRRKRARMALGLSGPEIGATILALLVFVLAVIYYLTALSPEQTRLRAQEQELQRLNDELAQTQMVPGGPQGPNIKDALASLQTFKGEILRPLASGRIALINEVNALAKKHSVTLTSGIDMPLEKGAAKTNDADSKRKKKAEEVLNAFPRLDMHFTVFGQYPNLRTFLNDMEHSKQFFVLKTVSLVFQEDKGGGEGGGRHRAHAAGSGLAMAIDASAYFQP
jgi:Tfp pilus assembly protein PilO